MGFSELGPFQPPGFPPRTLRVYWPQEHRGERRPALFLLDGQNVFEDREGQLGWYAHHAVEALPEGARRPIVIAVPHGGETRARELTPWITDGWGGEADRFLEWMVHALVPAVAESLPLERGPVGTAIGGASWGGLLALYAHFRFAGTFGGAIALSPSFWVGRGRAFSFFSEVTRPIVSRLYVDCGAHEDGGEMIRNAERVVRLLRERGYDETSLRWMADPDGHHSETFWRRRLPGALAFMYGR